MRLKEMEFMDQVDVPQNRFQGLHHQFVAAFDEIDKLSK